MPRSVKSHRTPAPPAGRGDSASGNAGAAAARFVEGVQATGRAVLSGMAHDAALARDEADRAPDFGTLAALQVEWASEEWTRAAQTWSGLWSALLDAQTVCWRDTETCLRAGLQPWVAGAPGALPIDAALETPHDLSPPALLQRATIAWLIVGKACMGALDHDLEATARQRTRAAA